MILCPFYWLWLDLWLHSNQFYIAKITGSQLIMVCYKSKVMGNHSLLWLCFIRLCLNTLETETFSLPAWKSKLPLVRGLMERSSGKKLWWPVRAVTKSQSTASKKMEISVLIPQGDDLCQQWQNLEADLFPNELLLFFLFRILRSSKDFSFLFFLHLNLS